MYFLDVTEIFHSGAKWITCRLVCRRGCEEKVVMLRASKRLTRAHLSQSSRKMIDVTIGVMELGRIMSRGGGI